MKKIVAWIVCALLALAPLNAPAEEHGSPLSGEAARSASLQTLETDFSLMAQSPFLALYLQNDQEGIAVRDLRNSMVWFSSVQPWQLYGAKKPNKNWSANIQSLFQIVYAKAENATGDTLLAAPSGQTHTVAMTPLKDGFDLAFLFTDLGIGLTLRFTLVGSALDVVIPQEGIVEGAAFYLMGVNLMPFFGATTDLENGYYLYPNGSGELYRFKDKRLRQNSLSTCHMPVYFPQTISRENLPLGVEAEWEEQDTLAGNVALLPVYGVKCGSAAFCAVITAGDTDADLFISPGGVSVAVNRIYTSFIYRKSYGVQGSEISVGGGYSTSYLAMLIDKESRMGDRSQRYLFLNGDDADYSGMACAARQEFLERGMLQKPVGDLPDMVVDLFCGVMQKQLLYDAFKSMTSFDQARQIVRDMGQNGVKPWISLIGWGGKGALGYPVNQPAGSKLGGTVGLKALAATCREVGIPLLLDANLFKMKEGSGGFDTHVDAARDGNDYIYSFTFSGVKHYLMHPSRAKAYADDLVSYAREAGVQGIQYQDYGAGLYDAYGRENVLRSGMAQDWQRLLDQSVASLGISACVGGNAYALSSASLIREVPEKSGMLAFGDENVPLYQMVVHGYVAYTAQPVNLFYDDVVQRLKGIEYGFTPMFQLAYESTAALSDTAWNILFSARYASWSEEVKRVYLEQTGVLSTVRQAAMVKHERISDRIYRMRYDNGYAVYVNYGAEEALLGNVRVPAQGYKVVKEVEVNAP